MSENRGTGDGHSSEVKKQAMTRASGLLLGVVISLGSAPAAELVDLTKVDRLIAKEPKYQNQPRYALLVFGPKADRREATLFTAPCGLLKVSDRAKSRSP